MKEIIREEEEEVRGVLMTNVDGEHVAGNVFAGLRTTEHKRATIHAVRVRVDVTYLPQNTLIVVHRTTTCTSKHVTYCIQQLEPMLSATAATLCSVFTARRYASAVCAVVVCVCPYICLSVRHKSVLLKRPNVGSRNQRHTISNLVQCCHNMKYSGRQTVN